MKRKLICRIAAILLLLAPLPAHAAAGSGTEADHQQLRALLAVVRDAVNNRDVAALTPYLHTPFAATMITQDLITTPEELQAYYDKWMRGDNAFVKKLTIAPEADALTQIYDDKYGIVYGSNVENYELATGNNYTLHSRWTATVIKDDGRWKLLTVHAGINFVDNPVLAAATENTTLIGAGAGVIGLLVGLLLSWGYSRVRRRA